MIFKANIPYELIDSIKSVTSIKKDLSKYLLKEIINIISSFIDDEIEVWKNGFIVKRIKITEDIDLPGNSIIYCRTDIQFKHIKSLLSPLKEGEYSLDWFNNFNKIRYKSTDFDPSVKDFDNNIYYDEEILNIDIPIYLKKPGYVFYCIPITELRTKNLVITIPTYLDYKFFSCNEITGHFILQSYYLSTNIFLNLFHLNVV